MHESMQLSLREDSLLFVGGGLFLEPAISNSLIFSVSMSSLGKRSNLYPKLKCRSNKGLGFLSVSLSESFEKNEEEEEEELAMKEKKKVGKIRGAGAGAMNTTKHLWAGAVAAMVSRMRFIDYGLQINCWKPFILKSWADYNTDNLGSA